MASTSGGDGGGEPKSSSQVPGGEVTVTTGSGAPPSRYESQKRRDWNTFLQYLKNQKPPLSLAACSSAHVIEFLKYLDEFGKTKVHSAGCSYFGHPNPPAPCACPLKQAWGSLDALIGRLRDAYEENGGTPETNPFGSRDVRIYLREVREVQAKARGVTYEKKKKRKKSTSTITTSTPTTMFASPTKNVPSGDADDLDGKVVSMSLKMPDPVSQEQEDIGNSKIQKSPTSPEVREVQAVSVEEKGGIRELVSMSSGPVRQQHEGSSSSEIAETLSLAKISESDKRKTASVEENSGIEEVFSMPSKMSDRYDDTGKLLPINSEKQHELIPTAEENIHVRANIIFLDRDYLEESDPHIPTQHEASNLPTVSSSANSNQREETRPEGHDIKGIGDPKKRKRFNLFPWWNKK